MISFKRKNQGCGQLGILRSLGSVVFVVILCFWIVVTVTAPGVDQMYTVYINKPFLIKVQLLSSHGLGCDYYTTNRLYLPVVPGQAGGGSFQSIKKT